MKYTLLVLNFCVFLAFASSDIKYEEFHLQMIPSRSQFFKYEKVSLSCEALSGDGLLKRNITARGVESCPNSWGILEGSTCTIPTMYPFDSGLYWCESDSGEKSQAVHIKVTAGPVILEGPVHPVLEGNNVTLRCTNTKAKLKAEFYKDGLLIGSSFTETMTLHSVSKSDEGLYKCNISGVGESADIWLTVTVLDTAGPDDPAALAMSVPRMFCHVVVWSPYLLSTIILALIYREQRRATQLAGEDRSHHVIMEVD